MAEKSWNQGDVLTASDLDKWALPLVGGPTTADVSSVSAALITDPTLVVAVDVNAAYDVDFYAVFDGPGSGNGVNWSFTGPAGAALSLWVTTTASPGTNPEIVLSGPTLTPVLTAGTGVNCTGHARGTLVTAGTAGSLQFLFQQNASSGTATRRRARSRLLLRRIG